MASGALVALAFALAPVLANAQTVPSIMQNDTQRLQRFYQQQTQPKPKKPSNPVSGKKPEPAQPLANARNAHVSFVLKQVVFTPSHLLPTAALKAAVKPWIGKRVTPKDLDAMLAAVNKLYVERHITTARALFTSQTITDGVVHIDLVEGRLGKLAITGAPHLRDSFVRKRIAQRKGQVVDSTRLRKDLVYLNKTTDLQVRALLLPGALRGQTDIDVNVREPDRYGLDAFADNSGVQSTGRYRVGLQGRMYGLFGVDDRLEGNIAHSKGGNDGAISYSLPLFTSNGRLGVSYAYSHINIINAAFRNLDITGTSSVASVDYRQPFIATLHWQLSGVAALSHSKSKTKISGVEIADTTNRSGTLGVSLSHAGVGQTWSFTQLYTRLHSNEPLLGKSTFGTMPGSATFIQRLGHSRWALRANAGWQWSSGNLLPSADLFQIGGPASVRGYERGVLAGPRGYYVDLEMHRSFSRKLDIYGFFDYGTVRATFPNKSTISGAGVGALWQWRRFTVSGDVAHPLQKVTPDQSSFRVDARVNVHFD